MTRRKIRENIFCILFNLEFHSEEEFDEQFMLYIEGIDEKPSEDETEEIKSKVFAIRDKLPEIDPIISESAQKWKIGRIGKADLTILRLAVYEMLYDDTVPMKVAINEAVELAKLYGMNDKPSFINGVLSKVADDHVEE